MFAGIFGLNLSEIGTEQTRRVKRAFLALATYVKKTSRVRKFFSILSCAGRGSKALINQGLFSQTFLNSVRRDPLDSLDMTTTFVVEVHKLFHSIAMVEEAIQAKPLKRTRSNFTETLIGCTVQQLSKACMVPPESPNLFQLAKLVFTYIFSRSKKKRFLVHVKREQELVPRN